MIVLSKSSDDNDDSEQSVAYCQDGLNSWEDNDVAMKNKYRDVGDGDGS